MPPIENVNSSSSGNFSITLRVKLRCPCQWVINFFLSITVTVFMMYVFNDINKVKPTADSRLSASFKIASQPSKEDVYLRNNDYFYKSRLVAHVHPDTALYVHVFLVQTVAEARDLRAIVDLPPPQKCRVRNIPFARECHRKSSS